MKRLIAVLVGVAATAIAAPSASADVHSISAAECAAPGAPSGATATASRNAPGRPDAPIPVTASGGKIQSRGGEAPVQGTNC
jgi:hypothetical protein